MINPKSEIGNPKSEIGNPKSEIGNPKSKIEVEMDEQEFKDRTKKLALRVIRLVNALPKSRTADIVGKQLLRSATSVGANYRAACRGKSPADVIAKLSIVEEEGDETLYWLELLVESGLVPAAQLADLMQETDEIVAMTVASIKTMRKGQTKIQNPKSKIQDRRRPDGNHQL